MVQVAPVFLSALLAMMVGILLDLYKRHRYDVNATREKQQRKIEEPVPYATAIEVHDILVRPSIVKCRTCRSKIDFQPDHAR
jgi:hypothetical protein